MSLPAPLVPLLTPEQVADRLNISLATLRNWRGKGKGPLYRKIVRLIRYHPDDVQAYINSALTTQTPHKPRTRSRPA